MNRVPRGKKRYRSQPLRKTVRPWRSPEMIENAHLERLQKESNPVEWTPDELDRIWKNVSG